MALWSHGARAESFFQAEVGLGAGFARDMGDDIWVQKKGGIPDNETLITPTVVVGVTGILYRRGFMDARYHLDYTYSGQQRASCMCVSDADYFSGNYNGTRYAFNGFGHVQGISFTLDVGYTLYGWRLFVEGGPWVDWATWHESINTTTANHKTTPEFGWVYGGGVEKGNLSLRYRYYQVREAWNPNPGLVTGISMLYLNYRF